MDINISDHHHTINQPTSNGYLRGECQPSSLRNRVNLVIPAVIQPIARNSTTQPIKQTGYFDRHLESDNESGVRFRYEYLIGRGALDQGRGPLTPTI
ncbi:hypothetical protein JTB14_035402 [Gonioctena quinquepunctata]|nr:hypothetical protein JTB14_035402 [Gonioctena quinquepunctata]